MDIPRTLVVTTAWVAGQDPAHWLTARELALCGASSSPRRCADRLAGRMALKRLLWETFDVPPLACEIGSDGPAPSLSRWPGPQGLTVSLSHSAGTGAASWAWRGEEGTVGVDLQHIRPVRPGLRERVLAASEQQSGADTLLLWALKEAAIKARRQAWGRPLREIMVRLDEEDAEHGTAQIAVAGEPIQTAGYTRQGDWWLARATRAD